MHIPDGWIDLPTSAVAAGAAGVTVAVAARRTAVAVRRATPTLPAVLAAYLLVAQLLVVPVGFGTSAHLVGTGLATLLVGPAMAIVCVAVVVVVQALLLAEGGVTAIGLNVCNDGIVPALVTAGVVRGVLAVVPAARRRLPAVAGAAAGLGALASAAAVTAVFVLGGTDAVSATAVAASLGLSHLVVAAVEGGLTAAVVASVLRLRPDLLAPLTSAARASSSGGDGLPGAVPGRGAPGGAPHRTGAPPAGSAPPTTSVPRGTPMTPIPPGEADR